VAAIVQVQAGELKIIETDAVITVEYSGTPAESSSESVKPVGDESNKSSDKGDDANAARVRYLTAQIEQLSQEADEMSMQSGTETEDEQAKKNSLVEEKRRLIEIYTREIHQTTDRVAAETTDRPQPGVELRVKKQNNREGKKQQLKVLRKLRKSAASVATPD
jgi:hypothetical protein